MRWGSGLAAIAALWLSGCSLAEYTVGGAGTSGGSCPEGQVVCGDGCAAAGECDDCPAGQERCQGQCVAAGSCEQDTGCPSGQVECDGGCAQPDTCPCDQACESALEACVDDACACRPGLTRCGADCVDIRANAAHCNGCGLACGAGLLCQDGECVAACDGGRQGCDGACIDVEGHSLHCGECGKLCPANEVCLSGECHPFTTVDDCDSCPCAEACEAEDDDPRQCCDSPFLGAPVCVAVDCS